MSEYVFCRPDELYHYGVLGMRWGVRRYQNKDGSLTNAGKTRYRDLHPSHETKIVRLNQDISIKNAAKKAYTSIYWGKNGLTDVGKKKFFDSAVSRHLTDIRSDAKYYTRHSDKARNIIMSDYYNALKSEKFKMDMSNKIDDRMAKSSRKDKNQFEKIRQEVLQEMFSSSEYCQNARLVNNVLFRDRNDYERTRSKIIKDAVTLLENDKMQNIVLDHKELLAYRDYISNLVDEEFLDLENNGYGLGPYDPTDDIYIKANRLYSYDQWYANQLKKSKSNMKKDGE